MPQIKLLGDLSFTGILNNTAEENKSRFERILPFTNNGNFLFANLETPIKADDKFNEHKKLIHYSNYLPTKELLKLLKVNCVSLANNHIYDCKLNGLKATINLLDELGIKHTGAGWEKEHILPVFLDTEGIKIGFFAYVDKSTNPKTEYFPELLINYFEPEKVIKDIKSIRNVVNIVIVSIHWGVDYSYYPSPKQISVAHNLIDAGADIIMGHHPHTIQPYEKYKNGLILYSLGTFIFGDIQRGSHLSSLPIKTKTGVIINYDLSNKEMNYQGFKIQKYNYLKSIRFNFNLWSSRILKIAELKRKFLFVNYILNFKESFIDRCYDFFFGYYRKPLNSFSIRNLIKKFKNSHNEYNRLNKI